MGSQGSLGGNQKTWVQTLMLPLNRWLSGAAQPTGNRMRATFVILYFLRAMLKKIKKIQVI